MHRVYEIFEVPPNGSPQRVTLVSGLDSAKTTLHELATQTRNECFAADVGTRQIVALMNVPTAKWRTNKYVFQICYDEQRDARRAELLKSRDYSVTSVIGNEAAKLVLGPAQQYDFFVVGPTAAEDTRREIVLWLGEKYPSAKILALNPPNQEILGADYNVSENDPENWLAIISKEFANSGKNPGSSEASASGARQGSVIPITKPNEQLHPLCHEHHVVMKKVELLVPSAGPPALAYACPEPDCSVRYGPVSGYFIVPEDGHGDLEITPSVTCPRDGRRMYLAEISAEKRDFRLWRCPQGDSMQTNEDELVGQVRRKGQG